MENGEAQITRHPFFRINFNTAYDAIVHHSDREIKVSLFTKLSLNHVIKLDSHVDTIYITKRTCNNDG